MYTDVMEHQRIQCPQYPPYSPVNLLVHGQEECHLYFTVRNNKHAVLERTGNISYPGHIRKGAKDCYVSFPGKYTSGWDALTKEKHLDSVACVFLCTPEDGLGQHYIEEASGRCMCHTIYGERDYKQFGYLRSEEAHV